MALTEGTDLGVVAGDSLLPRRQAWSAVPLERGADAATGALVTLVREGHHVGVGERVGDAVGAGRGQVVGRAGQAR